MSPVVRVIAGVWAVAIVTAMGAIAVVPGAAELVHTPPCIVRYAFGIDCLFCGMTRATAALARGDVGAALDHHPFAPLVLLAVLGLLVIVAAGRVDVLLRGRRPHVLLIALIVLWAARLLMQ